MFGIGEFFNRIKGSFAKEIALREAIRQVIQKNIGIDVPITAITVKNGIVSLAGVSQAAKSAIYIKKQAILKEFQTVQNVRAITDIR